LVELSVFDGVANVGLNGSGMIVIHPPFQMLAHMHSMLPLLWQALSPEKRGSYRALMLVDE
jgi:23S rRNA A2030 N6-methylase RlmJ